MIIFHEGLPRSGKSYEAIVYQIIPALKDGRKVFTNIKGIDHAKIADILEIEVDLIKELLIHVEWDDTPKMHEVVENDALVVIDEIQDFWPSKPSKKMPNDVQQWITQHGHKGLDIVLMGQDMRDADPIWRRRVDQKIVFVKLGALGMETRYSWQNYKATSAEKFKKISGGQKKYDAKYFDTYQSHEPETRNKSNKQDDRSNLFKTRGFRFGLPVVFILAIVAVNWLWGFFHKPPSVVKSSPIAASAASRPAQIDVLGTPASGDYSKYPYPVDTGPKPAPASPVVSVPVSSNEKKDAMLADLAKLGRPRLSGFLRSNETGVIAGVIEWLDDSFHAKESMTFVQLIELGYTIKPLTNAVLLIDPSNAKTYVSAWPIDPFGRVSNEDQRQLRDMARNDQQLNAPTDKRVITGFDSQPDKAIYTTDKVALANDKTAPGVKNPALR